MPAPRSTSQRPRRKSAGGSIGPLFFFMAIVVLGIIAAAVIFGSKSEKPAPANPEPKVIIKSVPVTTKWPHAEPWNGLEVGTSREQVIALFGKPNIEEITPHGYERLEFHDDPSRAGVFGNSGGSMLTVFIDKQTQKVLYFIPPGAVIRSNPQ